MTNEDHIDENLSETELLLPWYVNGKISDSDRKKVEAWLSENPDAEAHLQRVTEEMDLAFIVSEQMPRPSRASFDSLMADVGPGRQAQSGGFAERFWAMLSPRYALAGAAALCLVVLAQAAALTMMNVGQPEAEFAVASQDGSLVIGQTALVRFAPDATIDQIGTVLTTLNLTLVDGPKPGGVYVIAASDDEAGTAALSQLAGTAELVTFFAEQN